MSSNTHTVKVSPDGRTIRVTMAANTPADRKEARTLACRAAGTVGIGAAEITESKKGTRLTWTLSDKALASRKVVRATPSAAQIGVAGTGTKGPRLAVGTPEWAANVHPQEEGREAFLLREIARLSALAGESTAPAAASPRAAKANPFAAKRAAATCKTCDDFGVVRKAGDRAGKAYRTQAGADAAKANGNAVPCPTHKRAKRSA